MEKLPPGAKPIMERAKLLEFENFRMAQKPKGFKFKPVSEGHDKEEALLIPATKDTKVVITSCSSLVLFSWCGAIPTYSGVLLRNSRNRGSRQDQPL